MKKTTPQVASRTPSLPSLDWGMSYFNHFPGYFFYDLAFIIYLYTTVAKIELPTDTPTLQPLSNLELGDSDR